MAVFFPMHADVGVFFSAPRREVPRVAVKGGRAPEGSPRLIGGWSLGADGRPQQRWRKPAPAR